MAIDRVHKPKYIVLADDSATFQGPWLNVNGLDNLSFHCQWASNTLQATLLLEGSNAEDAMDVNTRVTTPSTRLTPAPIATLASGNPNAAAGKVMFVVTGVSCKWVRLVVTRSAGGAVGDFSAAFMGKGV